MKILPAAILSLVCATKVSALSCMPPDAARTFQYASESEALYMAIWGELEFEPITLPDMGVTSDPAYVPPSAVAVFTGKALSQSGFVDIEPREIIVQPSCVGSWCGNLTPNEPVLAYVEIADDQTLTLNAGPCYSWHMPNPTPAMISVVETCIQGGPCEPDPFGGSGN